MVSAVKDVDNADLELANELAGHQPAIMLDLNHQHRLEESARLTPVRDS